MTQWSVRYSFWVGTVHNTYVQYHYIYTWTVHIITDSLATDCVSMDSVQYCTADKYSWSVGA